MAKVRVRNLHQTHIKIDARISKKTCLLADNCRHFVDHYKPWQGCWLQWKPGLQTGVGVRCSIVLFDFLCCELSTVVSVLFTACGFVRLHKFCWIGDKGNVNILCWHSFFAFCAVRIHVVLDCFAVPECKCKQCGFVPQKIKNASTTRMYYSKNHFPRFILVWEHTGEVFNFECLVVLYTYEIWSTYCDSKCLPNSGIPHVLQLLCLLFGGIQVPVVLLHSTWVRQVHEHSLLRQTIDLRS